MKLLGILLFLSASLLFTACTLTAERERCERVEGIYLLLMHIKHGVCEESLPLGEIYESFENRALSRTPFLASLKQGGLSHALKNFPPPVDSATLRSLTLYAEGLGKRFSEEERKAAEKECARLADFSEKQRIELPSRLKMRRTLFLCGSGMALLLFV